MKRKDYNKEEIFTCVFDGWENIIQSVNDHSITELNIPPEIGGSPVTCIGNNAFMGCDQLKRVRIPDSVHTIGNNAFKDCVNLKEIELSYSLEKIGAFAFSECGKLENVIMSNKVKRIEINSFKGCRKFSKVMIKMPETEKKIPFAVACGTDNSIWMYMMAITRACASRGSYLEKMDKYDAIFMELASEDDIYRIAVQRLREPFGLTAEMRRVYRSRLRNMVKKLVQTDQVERLTAIGELNCIDVQSLEQYIESASRRGSSCTAYLLEYKHRRNRIGLSDFSL